MGSDRRLASAIARSQAWPLKAASASTWIRTGRRSKSCSFAWGSCGATRFASAAGAAIMVAIAWGVPLLLSAIAGRAVGPAGESPFLLDIVVWARFFVAVGAFILAEQMPENSHLETLRQFGRAPMIASGSLQDGIRAVLAACRRRDSHLAEAVCLMVRRRLSSTAPPNESRSAATSLRRMRRASRLTSPIRRSSSIRPANFSVWLFSRSALVPVAAAALLPWPPEPRSCPTRN
jgi:hypothetical protein